MIPRLFSSNEVAFSGLGLGDLVDCTACEVTEERNGSYELVLGYPVSGILFDKLQIGRYIYATHDDTGTPQAFEIYKISAPLDGIVTINAWHISYKLNNIIVEPFSADSCANAIAGVGTNSINTNPFTFQTDKTVLADFELTEPRSARAILGGSQGSILDVYGTGEYEFDMFTVKLLLHRGTNKGVVIRYGKNLRSLDYELDASNQFNAVVPFWTNDAATVYVNHLVVRTGETPGKAIALDLSSAFETQPSEADLEAAAQAYVDNSDNYLVKDNLEVDFVQLWQTEEYKGVNDTQRVGLCDTVTIFYEKFGINATAKVIKTVYDTLRDRFILMELGEAKTTLAQQIQQDVSGGILAEVPNTVKRIIRGDIECNSLKTADAVTADGRVITKNSFRLVNSGAATLGIAASYNDGGSYTGQIVFGRSSAINGIYHITRALLYVYSYNSSTGEALSTYEAYRTPAVSGNLASSKTYEIWTTKDIPAPPSANGTYTLQATRTSSGVTYSWV